MKMWFERFVIWLGYYGENAGKIVTLIIILVILLFSALALLSLLKNKKDNKIFATLFEIVMILLLYISFFIKLISYESLIFALLILYFTIMKKHEK